MEDQQDGVGVAAAPLSGNSPSKSLVEKMGSENQGDESFEGGDGGEIMVEIVGSDVYVDGISGDKEGNLQSGEVGDLQDKIEESQIHNVSEAMDVSSEGDGHKVVESVVGPSKSKDDKQFGAREVDITLCKSIDVKGDAVSALQPSGVSVVNDEVWNPGIEAVDGSSSAATISNSEVIGASPMEIADEKITEAEAVFKDGPAEAVLDEKTEVEEEKEVLPPIDDTASHDQFPSAVPVPNSEVIGASPMVIDEEKMTEAEAVTKEGPTEAVLIEKTEIEEKEEVLPSSDNTASRDQSSSAVTMANTDVTGVSPVVIVEEKITEAEVVTKDAAVAESLDCTTEAVDKKTEIEEKKEVLPSSDNTANRDQSSSAVTVANTDVTGVSPMVIAEGKTEAEVVTKDAAASESLDCTTKAVIDEKTEIEEKKVVLPSSDNTASHDQFSSAVPVPNSEVLGASPMEIVEEKITEAKAVTKDDGTSESLDHPTEAVLVEKTEIEEKKEVLPSTDGSAERSTTDEVNGPSPVVISEEKSTKDETVTKECADLVTPEPLNHPEETDVDAKTNIGEKQDVLPSADDSAKCAATDEVTEPSPMVIIEEKSTEDEAVNEDTAELVTPEPMIHAAETVSEIAAVVIIKEKSTDDEAVNKDSADLVTPEPMSHSAEAVSEIADIEQERKEISPSSDNSANRDNNADPVMSHEDSVDDKEVFAAESKTLILESDAQVSDVQDENQGCLNDAKLESDDLVDGVSHAGQESIHESSSVRGEATGNGECLGTDAELETRKAHENQVFSDEPTQLTDSDVTDVVDSDKSHLEIQEDKLENDQPVTTLGAEIDGQDAVISQAEVVDGEGSCEKVEEIKSEIPAADDSAENMQLVEEGVCSKVEEEDLMAVEDHAVGHDAIVNSEECGLPTKQEVSEQIIVTSNHEVGKIENTNSMPNEVTPVSDTAQIENAESVEVKSLENKSSEEDHRPRECNGFGTLEGHTSEKKVGNLEEEQESDHGEKEVDAELVAEGPSESEKSKLSTEETLKHTSSFRMTQSGYLTPPENEGNFAESDLVWGKVRSHPWWPGQIFDPDDASEKAVKYHKKDSYLVAYFGDQTFAWNDSSALKPFRSHFTQIEKQSSSEAFHNAVTCALEEVERRVELGLACSCIPKDAYAKIEIQVVENTGIREEASQRFGVDRSTQASHFEPDKLLDYIMGLASRASSRADRLDLVIARAQLSAFCRFKGYPSLTEFPLSGELLESDADTEKGKRRHVLKEGSQSKKERSMVELMGDREYSPDDEDEFGADDLGKSVGKKRKALDPLAEGSEKRVTVYAAKVSNSATQAPKPSFKIGECIRRVASQLTGSAPSIKDETIIDGSQNIYVQSEKQSAVVSAESLSVSEMLSRIELVALDPKKRHSFHNNIRAFFMGFRSSIAINRRGRKKKSEQAVGGSGEEFEFDDINDSYWTDRIVQNYPEEQLPHEGENGTANLQVVAFGGEKPVKTGRKPHSRKRFSSAVSPTTPTVEDENAKRRKQESSPAELILNFAERNRVPSEINLNKMFRRFGPLMESETEVDHESACAKVIFKRGSDAEVARNSAEKFSIFGPVLVNYQIGYSPVISVKILPVAMPQPQEDETLMV